MKRKIKHVVGCVLCFGLVCVTSPARAALTFYTDRAAWTAAVSGDIVTETFNAVTPYYLTEGVNAAGLIEIELVNYPYPTQYNEIDDGYGLRNIDGTVYYYGACYPGADVSNQIHLPESTAFGGDFRSTYSSTGLWLEVNGTVYAFSDYLLSGTGTGFLGFVASKAFTDIKLFTVTSQAGYGETFGMDNVSFVAVPEPTTLALLGLGGLLLRKRRHFI